jgi:hypothetical protein
MYWSARPLTSHARCLQDALDKGVNTLAGRSGHQMNAGTTEKVSDGIRTGFNKVRRISARCP